MNLHYLIGDATHPTVKPAIIAHICNDCQPGRWGAGFVLALSKINRAPQESYIKWSHRGSVEGYELGAVQLVPFAENVIVANMIAQHDTRWKGKVPPIRYEALEQCLNNVYRHAKDQGMVVCGPRFGADLAGGDWPTIETLIKKTMTVDTYIYTLESQKDRWPTQYENDLKKVGDSVNPKKYIDKDNAPATNIPSVLDAGADPNDFIIQDDDQQVNGTDLSDLFR
jgi:O-acetyl-ADP-ribose deacetylase (regulator of RNase III)